jgi:hypothetical protein
MGGLVAINHMPWSNSQFRDRNTTTLQNHPSLLQLFEWGADAVEVVGGDVFDLRSYQFAKKHNMLIVTGSDMHRPVPAYSWTIANPKKFTKEDIWIELLNKRTGFLYGTLLINLDPEGLNLMMPEESKEKKYPILDTILSFADFIGTFVSKQNGQWDSQVL